MAVAKNFALSEIGQLHETSICSYCSGVARGHQRATGAVRLFTAHAAENDPDSGYAQIAVFAKAIAIAAAGLRGRNKTSYHDLVYAAMKGMLASLDPHSQFMEPDDFRDMQDDTRSRFNGSGIEVSGRNGVLTVVTPMEDTPAAKAGILAGDQILKINGTLDGEIWSYSRRSICCAANPDKKRL